VKETDRDLLKRFIERSQGYPESQNVCARRKLATNTALFYQRLKLLREKKTHAWFNGLDTDGRRLVPHNSYRTRLYYVVCIVNRIPISSV